MSPPNKHAKIGPIVISIKLYIVAQATSSCRKMDVKNICNTQCEFTIPVPSNLYLIE
jgi:hypothetical protein